MPISTNSALLILLGLVSINTGANDADTYANKLGEILTKIDQINKTLDGRMDDITGRLSDEQEKLAKLEHLDGMAVQLLPVLERNFKICLSDSLFEKPKCNLGDIRCHEIDLREKTANCAMCVNGTLIPDTDDGPPDYCVHFVTIQKTTNINIIFEEYEVTFTYNGTILGRVPLNFGHSLEDNPKCNCTWALFNYTSFNNTPTISKLNDLLYCVQKNDECSSTDWLCFANSTGNVGRCYDHTATCQLQNGIIPICSLAILPQISVNIKLSCPSGGHGTIGMNCDFTWELESKEFLVNGNDMSFEINWDDKKIENLQCSGASEWTCFNTFCNDSNSTVYKYNFTTCQFVSIPAGKISEQPSVQPNSEDSGVGATAWLVVIIVLILIVFLAYVTYQNYEKINNCVNGTESGGRPPPTSRGRGRGRIKGKYGPIPMEEVVTRHDE